MKRAFAIIIKFLPLLNIFWVLLGTTTAYAQTYQLLEPLPFYGVGTLEHTNLAVYLETVFAFGISLAGILAVISIVVGGIQYIIAYGNPGQIENAKNRIWQAILGLLLVISAWLILYTINPDLAKGTLTIPPI